MTETETITISLADLGAVLRDQAMTVTGDGRAKDVFDALAARIAASEKAPT